MRPAAGGRWCLGAVVVFAGLLVVRETRVLGESRHSRWTPLHHAARAAATLLAPRPRAEAPAIVAARPAVAAGRPGLAVVALGARRLPSL